MALKNIGTLYPACIFRPLPLSFRFRFVARIRTVFHPSFSRVRELSCSTVSLCVFCLLLAVCCGRSSLASLCSLDCSFLPSPKVVSRADRHSPPTRETGAVREKFLPLAERFDGFEQQLLQTREKKKQEDDKKIIALQMQITGLRDSLTLEAKNRAESMKALQAVRTPFLFHILR